MYVAFLDADDAWTPGKLRQQLSVMNSGIDLCGHEESYRCVRAKSSARLPKLVKIGRTQIMLSNRFPTSSVMVRREIGLRFDPVLKRAEDYKLWLSIVLAGFRAVKIRESLSVYYKPRYGYGGLSKDIGGMCRSVLAVYREFYHAEKIGAPLYFFASAYYVAKTVRKYVVALSFKINTTSRIGGST